ncbi:GspH/FimT family pseudopilin [Haliea sp. E17]|uniref:GspH/FimT family pseudopilin n=1 Tax=Haliea sp. E17 TaxID=3401576 RepID=UPI003AACF4C9
MRRSRAGGFTLIELMIVLVILSFLAALGAPAFRGFIVEQRMRTTTADLRIALMTARSEAVKRNRDVVLSPAAGGWNTGWFIPDPAGGGRPDLLTHEQPGAGDMTIAVTGGTVGFEASGRAEGEVIFTVTAGSGDYTASRCLKLSVNGYLDNSCS